MSSEVRRTLNKENGFHEEDIESKPFIAGSVARSNNPLPTTLKSRQLSSPTKKLFLKIALVCFVGIALHSFFSPKKQQQQLLSEDEAPIPVILMADGRTGSSVTWMTISRMTGFPNIANEFTGQQQQATREFFDSIDPKMGSHFAVNRLIYLQHNAAENITRGELVRGEGVVGFQWKPIRYGIEHEYGQGALDEIAAKGIRVIHLTRNPLDRLISNQKHKQSNGAIEAHCAVDDEECIKEHHEHEKAIVLPTGKELVQSMRQGLGHDIMTADILATRGIRHIHVDYDKLYHLKKAYEWMRIFKFLGRGPMENLTMEEVQSNFDLAPTTASQHKDIIANFDEVQKALEGAGLAYLVN